MPPKKGKTTNDNWCCSYCYKTNFSTKREFTQYVCNCSDTLFHVFIVRHIIEHEEGFHFCDACEIRINMEAAGYSHFHSERHLRNVLAKNSMKQKKKDEDLDYNVFISLKQSF